MQHGLLYLSVGESMERNGDGNGSHQRDLTGIIELYLTSCRIEGKSAETVRSYRESLGIFTNVIGEKRLPEKDLSELRAQAPPGPCSWPHDARPQIRRGSVSRPPACPDMARALSYDRSP